jgi:hypothetical protein
MCAAVAVPKASYTFFWLIIYLEYAYKDVYLT